VQFGKQIRSQMYYGIAMLLFIVLALSAAGLHGVMKFRKLTRDIRDRAHEMPLVARLSHEVSDLRVGFSHIHQPIDFRPAVNRTIRDPGYWTEEFQFALSAVGWALDDYEHQLESLPGDAGWTLGDNSQERESVARMRDLLAWLNDRTRGSERWAHDRALLEDIDERLNQFQEHVSELPAHMKQRMETFAENARTEYRTWITLSAMMTAGAVILLMLLMRRFHNRIFRPLDVLVRGSRRVASGDFDHRIEIRTDDEVAELARALNAMTENFQEIKRDLNRQVQERTSEVVRSEQMASVGFLAAGVAHEINNPLASIAWSAESLEMRIHDILAEAVTDENRSTELSPVQLRSDRESEIAELKKYLKRIQDEAFRCKGITSGLLDFSRLGEARKSSTELAELIDGVIEMIRPLSRYRDKEIILRCDQPVRVLVNPQEIKQVVLNLVTNALDSIDPGGQVTIELSAGAGVARLTVADNGCGMTPEVLGNIFKPFFTRRRDGQGTGLGLSITYRIIEEHGGSITPFSEGAGLGSRFTVTLPLVQHVEKELQAA
jgi:signal transduction histidine kinase